MRIAAPLALLAAVIATASIPAAAQVGHPPEASPYADIPNGHSVTPVVGYFAGGGGRFGIGAHNGATFGVRYDLRTGKAIQFGFSVARGELDRFIVDPFVDPATRVAGPVKQQTTFADVTVQFNLSGGKTWRRLAPYTGVTLGIAIGEDVAADTSGYDFGSKFYAAPQAGLRLFVTRHLHLRGEVRAVFWKLNYPTSFADDPPGFPGTPEAPTAVSPDGQLSQWSVSPWFQVGIGYLFRF